MAHEVAMTRQYWTQEEEEFLLKSWGKLSTMEIGRQLGRNVTQVRSKAVRMDLGRKLERDGQAVGIRQMALACGMTPHTQELIRFFETRGLRVLINVYNTRTYYSVMLDEFWAWAEKNRNAFPVTRIRPYSLGAEPAWVDEQRRRERAMFERRGCKRWTDHEEMLLRSLIRQGVPISEICKRLGRGEHGIRARAKRLGIEFPFLRKISDRYTEEDERTLRRMIRDGCTQLQISAALNRSMASVYSKMLRTWGTRIIDEARQLIIREEREEMKRRRKDA